MMSFGRRLRLTLFGSSHGPEVGAILDGLPAGTPVDLPAIQRELDRRRPVGRRLATRRREEDLLVVDSGVSDGRTTGGPIRIHVANEDVRAGPYRELVDRPRPGHADYPARVRFGPSADLSGGGIFSGRMTVGLVAAGALVRPLLEPLGVRVAAYARSIGPVDAPVPADLPLEELRRRVGGNEAGAGDLALGEAMGEAIAAARRAGDSLGGTIECRVAGLPVGVGEPFFDSVESELAHLAFAIPAVRGIEFGEGFSAARLRGSEHNDAYEWREGGVRLRTNRSGGALGGLTTGAPLVFRVAVKPTPSIALPQTSVDLREHRTVELRVKGRHDPCIVPRAVVVVESIAWFGLAELMIEGGFVR